MSLLTNLLDYYNLNVNSNDVAGANNGTDTAITYSSANGKVNNGAGFNGTSSGIAVNNSISTSFSISFWIKFNSFGSVISFFDKYPSILEGFRIWGGTTWNGLLLTTRELGEGVNTNWVVPFTPTFGTWYHFVWTYDSGVSNLYKDGSTTPIDTKTGLVMGSSVGTLTIGVDNAQTAHWFDGCLDEIGIWTRALTTSEVATLYNSGRGISYPFVPTANFLPFLL